MSKLDDLLDNHEDLRWSEDEIADWLESLPSKQRNYLLTRVKQAQQKGHDARRVLCHLREMIEAHQEKHGTPWYVALHNFAIGWTLGGIITGNKKL